MNTVEIAYQAWADYMDNAPLSDVFTDAYHNTLMGLWMSYVNALGGAPAVKVYSDLVTLKTPQIASETDLRLTPFAPLSDDESRKWVKWEIDVDREIAERDAPPITEKDLDPQGDNNEARAFMERSPENQDNQSSGGTYTSAIGAIQDSQRSHPQSNDETPPRSHQAVLESSEISNPTPATLPQGRYRGTLKWREGYGYIIPDKGQGFLNDIRVEERSILGNVQLRYWQMVDVEFSSNASFDYGLRVVIVGNQSSEAAYEALRKSSAPTPAANPASKIIRETLYQKAHRLEREAKQREAARKNPHQSQSTGDLS